MPKRSRDFTLDWYETELPAGERRRRGHYSTPPQLVERILDACGYLPEHDLSQLRVLDPACGSGNFLAAATRRLIASCERSCMPEDQQIEVLQRNIWGFDPDPVSCFLTQMQLASVLTQAQLPLPPLLHLHQADGLVFPWEEEGADWEGNVDLFLANPPYLAAKNTDLSVYRATHHRGQFDSYLLFLKLALQVVRPGGWLGLVLPDPLLARTNATGARKRLLEETTIHHLWHLSGVFAALVGAVVVIAQKKQPPALHQISWQRARWQQEASFPQTKTVSQALLCQQPAAELRYLLTEAQDTLPGRLHQHLSTAPPATGHPIFARLGNLVMLHRGEELGKESSLLASSPPTQEAYPVLLGGVDVQPYRIRPAQRWVAREHIVKSLERYLVPKLLVVKSTGYLQAALDLRGHVVLQTLYVLLLPPRDLENDETNAFPLSLEDTLYFLLALLNSRLLNKYIYLLHTAYKWVQPQIEQHVLAQLPIPLIAAPERAQIIERARHLMCESDDACSLLPPVVELEKEPQKAQLSLASPVLLDSRQPGPEREALEQAICRLYEAALRQAQQTTNSAAIL